MYAKLLQHLRKSINQTNLEYGTYEHIVTHHEKELELNGLKASDQLQIDTVGQHAANTSSYTPKPT